MNAVSAYKESEMKRAPSHPITQALLPLIAGICFYKDVLEISDNDSGGRLSIFIVPHMADYPVLSGSGGRQIRALRYIVRVAAERIGITDSEVHLDESYIGEREPSRPFQTDPKFDERAAMDILHGLMRILWPKRKSTDLRIDRREKLHFYIEPIEPEDVTVISALGDLFYCYGMRNGKKIEIHKEKTVGETCK